MENGYVSYYPRKTTSARISNDECYRHEFNDTPSPCKAGTVLKEGDIVYLEIPEIKPISLTPEDIDIDIVYEDKDLAIINKPQGLTVHPAAGAKSGTLVNALLMYLKELSGINGEIRPGIVHRLDKLTSGLLVVAKNDETHVHLSGQLADKTAARVYHALLEGVLKEDCGTVDRPIGRDPRDRKKMAIRPDGRRAVTHYKVLKRFENYTYAEFRLETGRTHQIRVHAKYLGHPVVGDAVYGYKTQKFKLNGQLLHAKELGFIHPATGLPMRFNSELPDYFADIIRCLK